MKRIENREILAKRSEKKLQKRLKKADAGF